jgi:acetyl esterase
MKIIKYIALLILLVLIVSIGYIYSLTYDKNGRLQWGQALFLKLAGDPNETVAQLKKMSVSDRSHLTDAVKVETDGLIVDTLKITADSLTTYIFKPKSIDQNSTVVIYYHGGAFVLPWMTVSATYAIRLARAMNAIVVGVDYRVAPEHPFPIPNDDCFATFLWTIENIKKWGGNPHKIVVAGESAGATLSTIVALRAKAKGLTNIKYQILDCPVTHVPYNTEAYKKLKTGYFLDVALMDYAVAGYLPNKLDYTNPLALPYHSDSLTNLPPAFVATCEFDPIKVTGKNYARKLKEANVTVTYQELKGMLHCIPGPFNETDRINLCKEMALAAAPYLNN